MKHKVIKGLWIVITISLFILGFSADWILDKMSEISLYEIIFILKYSLKRMGSELFLQYISNCMISPIFFIILPNILCNTIEFFKNKERLFKCGISLIAVFICFYFLYLFNENIKNIQSEKYILSTELSFLNENPSANEYCIKGFSDNESGFTWTNGAESLMLFIFDETFEKLRLSMEYFTYTESQRVIIYANGRQVADYVAAGRENKEIIIPGEYIKNNELFLLFEFPDAVSPKELGVNEDARELALAMQSIIITRIKSE